MLPRWQVRILAIALFMPLSGRAATLRVPADYATIQAGIDAAWHGDSVLVADGVFTGPGNRGMTFRGKAITVRSKSLDPMTCVVDCENVDRGFSFTSHETETSVLEGITITRGYEPTEGGGGIWCSEYSRPTIRNCGFLANRAAYGGGVACCSAFGLSLSGCRFEGNEALPLGSDGCGAGGLGAGLYAWGFGFHLADCVFLSHRAGTACVIQGAADFTSCSFIDNEGGGLVRVWDGSLYLTSCIFRGNQAIAALDDRYMDVSGCVFVANEGRLESVGGLRLRNTIFAFNTGGISCYGATPIASCCDLFGNVGGNWVDCLAGQDGVNGNLSADPLFCDLAAGDLTLNAMSPCAPDHSPDKCGLIGALPVACGLVAVQPETWGRLKALFR